MENREQEIEKLAWQDFQDKVRISFICELTVDEKKTITDVPAYQKHIRNATKLYEKRLAKKNKAIFNKKYPIIDVPASGRRGMSGGAYTYCFVYSKYSGNFILRGYSREVEEYVKKNYTHYFYNLSLWHHGNNRDIWFFWKKDISIHTPNRHSKIFKGNDRWKFNVVPRIDTHSWNDDYEEKQKLANQKSLWFKRMPKHWIKEFDNL